MATKQLFIVAVPVLLAGSAAAADPWLLRPGLWEITTSVAGDARLGNPFLPRAPVRICVDKPTFSLKGIFDGFGQLSKQCAPKVVSHSGDVTRTEDNFEFQKDIPTRITLPIQVERESRMVEGTELLVSARFVMGPTATAVVQSYTWLSSECGSAKPALSVQEAPPGY